MEALIALLMLANWVSLPMVFPTTIASPSLLNPVSCSHGKTKNSSKYLLYNYLFTIIYTSIIRFGMIGMDSILALTLWAEPVKRQRQVCSNLVMLTILKDHGNVPLGDPMVKGWQVWPSELRFRLWQSKTMSWLECSCCFCRTHSRETIMESNLNRMYIYNYIYIYSI